MAYRMTACNIPEANYDRVEVNMPKGKKAIVKEAAAAAGQSVSEYIISFYNIFNGLGGFGKSTALSVSPISYASISF